MRAFLREWLLGGGDEEPHRDDGVTVGHVSGGNAQVGDQAVVLEQVEHGCLVPAPSVNVLLEPVQNGMSSSLSSCVGAGRVGRVDPGAGAGAVCPPVLAGRPPSIWSVSPMTRIFVRFWPVSLSSH